MEVQVSAPSSSCTPPQSEREYIKEKLLVVKSPIIFVHNVAYLVGLGTIGKGASRKNLPVVEHALWEGLASSVGPQVSGEAEGLVDRQVGLDNKHGGSWGLGLLEHVASPSVQHTVDSSNSVFRTLKRKYFKNIQNI